MYTELANTIMRFEGGYSNHGFDSGGPTKYGMTQASWAAYRSAQPSAVRAQLPPLVKDATEAQVRPAWQERATNLNLADDMEKSFPIFSFHGLAHSRTLPAIRRSIYRLYGHRPAVSNLYANYTKFTQNTSEAGETLPVSSLTREERKLLDDLSAQDVQIAVLLARVGLLLLDTWYDLEKISTTKRSKGTSGPVVINGWISRTFRPAYVSAVPLPLLTVIAGLILEELGRMRKFADDEDLVLHPDEVPDSFTKKTGVRVSDVLRSTKRNFLWTAPQVQATLVHQLA